MTDDKTQIVQSVREERWSRAQFLLRATRTLASNTRSNCMGSRMGTVALALVALVLGWLGSLSLARDVEKLELTDFSIAAAGSLAMGLLLPRLGLEVWGENGLRFPTILAMACAAVATLIAANLLRGRGVRSNALIRTGVLARSLQCDAPVREQEAVT